MSPDHPRVFSILNILQNKSAGKNSLEIRSKFSASSLTKFLNTRSHRHQNIFQILFYAFFGYNIFVQCIYLANIQPNSKFHSPHPLKFSGSAPEWEIKFFLEPLLCNMMGAPLRCSRLLVCIWDALDTSLGFGQV